MSALRRSGHAGCRTPRVLCHSIASPPPARSPPADRSRHAVDVAEPGARCRCRPRQPRRRRRRECPREHEGRRRPVLHERPAPRQSRNARRRRHSVADVDELGVALCHEVGCDAGAYSAVTRVLADRLTREGSKHSAAVALTVRAGTSQSTPISSPMDENQRSRHRSPDICPPPRTRKSNTTAQLPCRRSDHRPAERGASRAIVRGIRGGGGRAGRGWASTGQCAGRSMLVIGGQAPACETLVTRNP